MTPQRYRVQSGDISLQVYTWGDRRHPVLVLVHGYPDNHRVWAGVAERLAARYFVIAYDVRGAGESDAPVGRDNYRMPLLSADLLAVVDALIPGKAFHLAAHDWGSIQSWESVTTEPLKSRILSYTTISGPCLDHMGYWMRKRILSRSFAHQRQVLKQTVSSWYIWFFQAPFAPELLWRAVAGRFWPLYLAKREGVHEAEPNPTQTRDGEKGVWLYRANFINKLTRPEARPAACPVQLIVPTRDNYVGTMLFDDLHEWVPELFRRDMDATHWVPLSHTDEVAGAIDEFVAAVERGDHASTLAALRVHGNNNTDRQAFAS